MTRSSEDSTSPAAPSFEIIDCRDLWGFDNHELVAGYHDPASGLRAFIAVHDTTLGPSLGGCRMWPYASEQEAISDVLRLAQGMSYKHAVAGTGQGGGKAVIIGNPRRDKSPELFRAFGRFVDRLEGRYITAEDVGMKVEDLCYARECTEHVSGLPVSMGGSGDPSPVTAYGVYRGIQAATAFLNDQPYQLDSRLDGIRVAVQGLGNVGYRLCEYLSRAGAKLFVTDIHQANVAQVVDEFSAEAVEPDAIYETDAEIFAPCALGGVLTPETVDRLRARVVAGAANNQLVASEVAEQLTSRGVLYAPDYVINAGGVINISYENSGYDLRLAHQHAERIGTTLIRIFQEAAKRGVTTARAADELACAHLRKPSTG